MSVPHGNGGHPEQLAPGLRNHFVYQVYNKAGAVIYVGCTRRPEKRWQEHRANGTSRQMVREAHRFRMYGPYDYPTARRMEREQQFDLRPKYNAIPITRDRNDAPWITYSPFAYLDIEEELA